MLSTNSNTWIKLKVSRLEPRRESVPKLNSKIFVVVVMIIRDEYILRNMQLWNPNSCYGLY